MAKKFYGMRQLVLTKPKIYVIILIDKIGKEKLLCC